MELRDGIGNKTNELEDSLATVSIAERLKTNLLCMQV